MDKNKVKISFGIIVLNGEPFTLYTLRALYPFAHQIIIVEGATKNSKENSSPDGHSTDGTLAIIRKFINEEDLQKKVVLVTKDGFWEEKDEMSMACANEITGNYLWQIDIDEFYLENDMKKIISFLEENKLITCVSFRMKSFWGGLDYLEEGPIFGDIYRIFKFEKGYSLKTHRPPIVLDDEGKDLKKINLFDGYKMKNKFGIFMYHYPLIFPEQVKRKMKYYQKLFNQDYIKWANENYFKLSHPYHVNNNFWNISWLRPYKGDHHPQVDMMMKDIKEGRILMEIRRNDDVEKLLKSVWYKFNTKILQIYLVSRNFIKYQIKKIIKND